MVKKENDNLEVQMRSDYAVTRAYLTREQVLKGVLFTHDNWRSPIQVLERAPQLASLIRREGLKTPPWAMPIGAFEPKNLDSAKLAIIRGNTRLAALRLLARDAEAFKAVFPKGLPVDVYTDVSEQEAAVLAMDNAASVGMEKRFDWQSGANVMFAVECTRGDVTVALEPRTEVFMPISDSTKNGKAIVDKRKKIIDMRSELEGPDFTGVTGPALAIFTKRIDAEVEELDTLIKNYRRGVVDGLSNHYNAGVVADWLLHLKGGNDGYGTVHPDQPADLDLSGIGYSNEIVDQLCRAAKMDVSLDQKSLVERLTTEQRKNVLKHRNYLAKLQELIRAAATKAAKKAETGEIVRPKALTGQEMLGLGSGRKSDGVPLLVNLFRGAEEFKGLSPDERSARVQDVDSLLQIAEIVSREEPEFWAEEVISRFHAIINRADTAALASLKPTPEPVAEKPAEPVATPAKSGKRGK
jgi:hypothetical protein